MREKDVCHHCGADKRDMARLTRELERARAEAERLRDRLQTVVDEQVSPHEFLPAEELITLLEHSLAEGRHERERLRGALERAERRLGELAEVDTFEAITPWLENEKPEERARTGAEIARAALAGEGEAKRCTWTYDETHCAWDSSCGEKWILMDGGPSENEIRFCHGCGKPVEVACEATPEKVRQGGGAMKVYLVVAYAREECEHMSAWASRDAAEREAQRLRHLHEKVKNIPWKHVHSMSDEAQIMRALHRVRVEEMEVRDG